MKMTVTRRWKVGDGPIPDLDVAIDKYLGLRKWQPWYAWHPVRLYSGGWAWNRVIFRRVCEKEVLTFKNGQLMKKSWEYEEPFIVALNQD